MDTNDDTMSDRLDFLADRHADFFEWLEVLWTCPEPPADWELFTTPPSDAEMEEINRKAEEILGDL